MDCDQCDALILAVFKNGPIWDKRHNEYGTRSALDKCWKEISSQMGMEEMVLRKKWKYFRDNFAMELSKSIRDGKSSSKWQYFDQLRFLKDVVSPRETVVGHTTEKHVSEVEEQKPDLSKETLEALESSAVDHVIEYASDYSDTEETLIETETEGIHVPFIPPPASPIPVARGFDSHYAKPVEVKERKAQKPCYPYSKRPRLQLESDAATEERDLMFFKTLLPHVKLIPHHLKLRFRSKILTIVDEFAYPENVRDSSSIKPRPTGLGHSQNGISLSSSSANKNCASVEEHASEHSVG